MSLVSSQQWSTNDGLASMQWTRRWRGDARKAATQMTPGEIRSTVASFWMTTPEVELLSCIALALASILERLDQVREGSDDPSDQRPAWLLARAGIVEAKHAS